MKPRRVVITIEADSNVSISKLREYFSESLCFESPIGTFDVDQVQVNVIKPEKVKP